MYRWIGMGVLIAGTIQAQNGPVRVSLEKPTKEAALDAGILQDYRRRGALVEQGAAAEFVERVGQKLAAVSTDPARRYRFYVTTESTNVLEEPIALPGGAFLVPARLLVAAESESEVAGMLAHSIVHVVNRHLYWTPRSEPNTNGTAARPEIVLINSNPNFVPLGMQMPLREREAEADSASVGVLARAGYDPSVLARYISRRQPDSPQPTLPLKQARLEALQALTQGMAPSSTIETSSQFEAAKAEAVRLTTAPSPRRIPRLSRER